jgi:hypothetical protein
MKGDFTRQTFDPRRHFTTVRMQQGRVQLDADWNEQADLGLYRVETEATDVIGRCGGPLHAAAFGVVLDLNDLDPAEKTFLAALDPKYDTIVAGDLVLTPGRYYVDGILCESEHAVPYTRQPDLPGLGPIDVSKKGFTIVYLDVWQRHLTYLDDPLLRETALGGPDTASRTKTVWQVRTVFVGTNAITCADEPQAYLDAVADGTGLLSARAKREEETPNPCLVPASAGYLGLENQLYRVEIHAPGEAYNLTAGPGDVSITIAAPDQVVYTGPSGPWDVGKAVEVFRSAAGSDPMEGFVATIVANDTGTKTLTLNTSLPDLGAADLPRVRPVGATFKWSRDNGSVVTLVSLVAGRELSVASVGPDEALGFSPGQWVELIDEVAELDGRPGFITDIEDVDPAARTVTLRVAPPVFAGEVLKLRRWDGVGAVKTNPPGTTEPFIELENGVQVSFSDGTYDTGDYWLIPARTATADERSGTIEWPTDDADEPLAQPPLGIRHHYCRLAILESDGKALEVEEDCRSLFPPLTELTSFFYVGGDGQEVMPDPSAPNAATPVDLPQPLEVGVANGSHPVEGATVRFAIFKPAPAGTVNGKADFDDVLTGPDGIASCTWAIASNQQKQQVRATLLVDGTPTHLPIDFSAQRSRADEVRYFPPAGCETLAPAHDVQSAIDRLGELVHLSYVSGNAQEVAPADRSNLEPLQVRVWSDCGPIKGAKVEFKLLENGESIAPPQATTDAEGLASAKWVLDATNERQRAIATLVDLGPNAGSLAAIHEPTSSVEFIAHLDLGAAPPKPPVIKIQSVVRGDGKDLVNDDEVAVPLLLQGGAESPEPGIVITTDRPIDPKTIAGKATVKGTDRTNSHPMCYVTIELPWPVTDADIKFWGHGHLPTGFETIVLAAEVTAKGKQILWRPDPFTRQWLLNLLDQQLEGRAERILTRLTLKGAFIRDKKRLFLDGEPFGPKSTVNDNEESGDDQPGGDFEIWFWLVRG